MYLVIDAASFAATSQGDLNMTIQIETRGRRHYLVGDTYPVRAAVKAAGCKWDGDARAWWTGKRETAERLVADVSSGAVKAVASYAKLADGSWGVRVPGAVAAGATITVETKSGSRKQETIVAVLSTDERGSVCSIKPRERKSSGRRSYGSDGLRDAYRHGWDGKIGSASYYSSGAFDELDM